MKRFSLLVIAFLTSSCAYYPHLADIPLIREKGDTRIEGGISVIPPLIRATVSHGVTENIAIQISGDIGANEEKYLQGAVGFYNNTQNGKVMEFYGGFGYGYSDVKSGHDSDFRGRLFGNYQFYFSQFNYGYTNIKDAYIPMESGFGLKLGYLHSKMTDSNFYERYSENEPYPVLKMNNIVIEPAVFLRFGGEKLKIQAGIGFCHVFRDFHYSDKRIPFGWVNFGLGLNYSL